MPHTAHHDIWIHNPFLHLCMVKLLLFHSIHDFLLSPFLSAGTIVAGWGEPEGPDVIVTTIVLFSCNNVMEKTVNFVSL